MSPKNDISHIKTLKIKTNISPMTNCYVFYFLLFTDLDSDSSKCFFVKPNIAVNHTSKQWDRMKQNSAINALFIAILLQFNVFDLFFWSCPLGFLKLNHSSYSRLRYNAKYLHLLPCLKFEFTE